MKKLVQTIFLLVFLAMPVSAMASGDMKRDTFLKFTEVAGIEKQYDQMIEILSVNFQQGVIAGFERGMSGKDVPEDAKNKLIPIVEESARNFGDIFQRLLKKEVTFDDLVTNVYFPVYKKHFSETEMLQIIKFYNSTVGKKLAVMSPALIQESAGTFNQVYGPKIQTLGGELIDQEIDKLLVKAKELIKE